MRTTFFLALFLFSACGQVTAYQTPDDSNSATPDASSSETTVDSLNDQAAEAPFNQIETSPVVDTSPPALPCEINIGPSSWTDECQRSHTGWCNSPEINAALQSPPHLETKTYQGTCQPGCLDNGKYLTVQEVCHDGTVCQLTTVAPSQKQPLCKH